MVRELFANSDLTIFAFLMGARSALPLCSFSEAPPELADSTLMIGIVTVIAECVMCGLDNSLHNSNSRGSDNHYFVRISPMTGVWALAALWLGLALIASLLSIWFRISSALSEIVVGTIAQLIIGAVIGSAVLGTDESWVKFLSGIGAIVLTFLAGAELDPVVFRLKWREAVAVGLASFAFPFLGCAAAARYLLGWEVMPSWLAGVAMSTTSVAVVYAVMLEFGFNVTDYGKTVLAACFITDLGTVVALGLIFAPFTFKTAIFIGAGVTVFIVLPWLTPRFFRLYGGRPSELETKFLL